MDKLPNIEYLAGLFDGEGSISICKVNAGNSLSLRVTVTNTYQEIVNIHKQMFGGSITCWNPAAHTYGISKMPQWRWKVSGEDASNFLTQVLPYLIIKNNQAELALEFQSRRTGPGNWRTNHDIELDKADKALMQELNSNKGKGSLPMI